MLPATAEEQQRFGFDEPSANRWWRIEKASWFTLIVGAGALGAFVRGPVSTAQADGSPLAVEYDRVVRDQAPTRQAIEGTPILLRNAKRRNTEALRRSRLQIDDVMAAARQKRITRPEDIQYAIVERSGTIGVIRNE
jgi:hypothetical protein